MKIAATVFACLLAIGVAAPVPAAVDNAECLACHTDKELVKKLPDGKTKSLLVDEAKFKASVHGKLVCNQCHADMKTAEHPEKMVAQPAVCAPCHEKQSLDYAASVHSRARLAGKLNAATCEDCHDKHEMTKATSPSSSLHHSRLATTCGRCHEKAAKDVARSVHGKALAAGVRDAPTCTDCHAEHRITSLVAASAMTISEDVCSRCHASERLATKYNLPADRVSTFFDSYHGLAARLGSTRAANCASCHGWHDVLPSSDPASSIHKANLPKTCGACHPGIGTRLAKGQIIIHSEPGAAEGKPWIVNFIARIYIVIIIIVIGAMLVHNAIDYIAKTREHIARLRLNGEERLSRSARVQHFILIALFALLAYTGFVHKYPDAVWSWPFQMIPSGNYVRSMIHHVAGWLFTVLVIGHGIGLATRAGRLELMALMLRPKDWHDLWATLAFNLGLRSTPPTRERFNYVEKSEYWALMWGSVIMILTGIALIFTEPVLRILPKVWLDISQVVHYYEAVLATLAIVVWHFYGVIFDPECYPMNPAWFIGKRQKPPEHVPPKQ